jgi:hypothetical protein
MREPDLLASRRGVVPLGASWRGRVLPGGYRAAGKGAPRGDWQCSELQGAAPWWEAAIQVAMAASLAWLNQHGR